MQQPLKLISYGHIKGQSPMLFYMNQSISLELHYAVNL
jgi:hypothetical protein